MKQIDLFIKSKQICDKSIITWTPIWEKRYTDICNCNRLDCEGCVEESYQFDIAEPTFHGEIYYKDKLKLHEVTCKRCNESWLNIGGLLAKIYSDTLPVLFERDDTFYRMLEKK